MAEQLRETLEDLQVKLAAIELPPPDLIPKEPRFSDAFDGISQGVVTRRHVRQALDHPTAVTGYGFDNEVTTLAATRDLSIDREDRAVLVFMGTGRGFFVEGAWRLHGDGICQTARDPSALLAELISRFGVPIIEGDKHTLLMCDTHATPDDDGSVTLIESTPCAEMTAIGVGRREGAGLHNLIQFALDTGAYRRDARKKPSAAA